MRYILLLFLIGIPSLLPAESSPAALIAQLDASYQAAAQSGNYADHILLAERALKEHPHSYEAAWRAARAVIAAGDMFYWSVMPENIKAAKAESVDAALAAEKELSGDQGARLIESGQRARSLAEQAVRLDPQRVEGHYYLSMGISHYALGKSIIAALREGLKGRFDEAVERAIALDAAFSEGAPLRVKGRSCFKLPWPLRDYDDSISFLLRAKEFGPAAALTFLFLGDSYWANGDAGQAREAWQKAVKLGSRPGGGALDPLLAANAALKLRLCADR